MNKEALIKDLNEVYNLVSEHDITEAMERLEFVISEVKQLPIHNVSDTLIAWEQFKKANWYESEAIDVEKMLMDKFQAIYGR